MKAAVYSRVGPASEVLAVHVLQEPQPLQGEVRVKVYSSGINPADVKRRAGERCRPPQFPLIIPHSDGAGVIDAVGQGVSPSRIGARVWLWNAQWRRPFGTAATFVTVPQEQAVPLPGNISFDEGASLGVPALTAHYCLTRLGIEPGDLLYVSGGGGVIGRYVTQLAKSRGAKVIATILSERKRAFAEQAGADLVINVTTQDFHAEAVAWLDGRPLRKYVTVDLAATLPEILLIAARHSKIVVYGSASDMAPELPILELQLRNLSIDFISGSEQPQAARSEAIASINELLISGRMRPVGFEAFEIDQIAEAHALVESGKHLEKVVVRPDPG